MNSLKRGRRNPAPFYVCGSIPCVQQSAPLIRGKSSVPENNGGEGGAISLPANESEISSEHFPRRSGTCFELSLGRGHCSNGRNEQRHTKWHNRQRRQDADRQIIASHR